MEERRMMDSFVQGFVKTSVQKKRWFATNLGRLATKMTARAGAHKKGKIPKYIKKHATYNRDHSRYRMDKRSRNLQMIRMTLSK